MNKNYLHTIIGGTASLSLFAASASAQVFWTNDTEIWSSDLSGGNQQMVYDGTGLDNTIVDVAATSSHIYWTDKADSNSAGGIWRANHDGTGAEMYISNDGSLFSPQFLQVDQTNNTLYFSDWTEGIFSADLDTGANLANRGNPAANNSGIGLRSANELLSVAAGSGDTSVYSTDLTDDSVSTVGDYAGTNQSYGFAYDEAGDTAYISGFNTGDLYSVDMVTGDETLLIDGELTSPLGMAMNPENTHLYIVGRGEGIYSYELATGDLATAINGDSHFGVAVIPEPSTYALIFGLGVGALLVVRRRLRK